ncbi:unnamed protein product, partial [Cyprideis torosa]
MTTFHGFSDSSALDILPSPGSQDALCKIFEATLAPGEPLLCEEFCYSGMIAASAPFQPSYIPVSSDEHGMCPESLENVLQTWPTSSRRPKLLYLTPNGSNPTGTSIPEDRKRRIYQICAKYDILIVEDDPYFFLQFKKPLAASFLSIDLESGSGGRVVRLDSFSKVLSAGLRFGWVTGPRDFLQAILFHQQASFMHVPTLTQMTIVQLLDTWGEAGFQEHVNLVQDFYRKRRDIAVACAEAHLQGLCDWVVPDAGMFLWMRVRGVRDTSELITRNAMQAGVAFLPGKPFCIRTAAGRSPDTMPFFRASYSLATPDQLDRGFRILAEILKSETAAIEQVLKFLKLYISDDHRKLKTLDRER